MKRSEQLAHALRDLVAQFLTTDVEFGPGTLVTVTRAEVTHDGGAATIFISALPEAYGTTALQLITSHLYELQGRVNLSLGRRHSPRLRLAIDPGSKAGTPA